MQLRVNFVDNHNMKIGRYDVPIDYLKNVVNKYPDHAFGHYFLAKCYRATDRLDLAERHFSRFEDICRQDVWWRDMAEKYAVSAVSGPPIVPPAGEAAMHTVH
jgi:tetratricopeptide (TPR) repeat protein